MDYVRYVLGREHILNIKVKPELGKGGQDISQQGDVYPSILDAWR